MNNDEHWQTNFKTLKAYLAEHGHLPNHHKPENRNLYSWAKYQRKKIKEGTLDDKQRDLFESLLAARSTEHTGGRRKIEHSPPVFL